MELNWINSAIVLLIGVLAFALSLGLAGWLAQFQGVFTIDRLFSQYSVWGVLGVVAILVFGGFYLARAGFEAMKGAAK
ncbi:MAG: hypothetical protein V1676_01340 [Candidatus Diapherotrites archaeon]